MGKTERINRILEGYLCCNFSLQQGYWANPLPPTEHAYNTATSKDMGMSSFFANYGSNPEMQWV